MDYKSVIEDLKNNQLSNLYLFHGSEHYLMDHVLNSIKVKIVRKEFQDLNYQCIDGKDTNITTIINACETIPFMGEKRLVIVKDLDLLCSKKSSEEEENRLIKYLGNLSNTTHLIFFVMESIDTRRKLIKTIDKNGKIIEFNKLTGKELYKWIEKTFMKYNKKIGTEEFTLLLDTVGYLDKNSTKNLKDVENEIKKISNYMEDRVQVAKTDIDVMAPKTVENNIFSLVDAIGEKNGSKALTYLNEMLLGGEPESKILYMITRQFRLLFQVKLLQDQGYTLATIAPKLGIQQFSVKKLLRQAVNFNQNMLKNALQECLKTELDMKKGKIDHRIGVELLICRFVKS